MNSLSRADGVHAGRLTDAEYVRNFSDSHAPLTRAQALVEAERCYYCYDAPCITACPTGIDIPSFIHRIAQDNIRGSASAILEANPLGGMCARVCPTENLCEGSCVRLTKDDKPVEIGLLQRYATDAYFANPGTPLFQRAAPTGKRIAVVGAGPAGLACAHGLARRGHDVVIYDANAKLGGLNEYGLAAYKTTHNFAQQEINWLLSIGGIEAKTSMRLGQDITLDSLVAQFDAVFLGLGMAGINALGITASPLTGLSNAVDFIAHLRQSPPAKVAVGRRVVVIGGGMTAVDAAVQSRLLGAEDVTIVYRRGQESMSASVVEQEWAKTNGVRIIHWATPQAIESENGQITGVRFVYTALAADRLVNTQDTFLLKADMVLKAIGQAYVSEPVGNAITLRDGRIATDEEGKSSHSKIWAGGDCRAGGQDLTVEAVEHGKRAAISIDQSLTA